MIQMKVNGNVWATLQLLSIEKCKQAAAESACCFFLLLVPLLSYMKYTLEPEMNTAVKACLCFWLGTDTLPLLPGQAAAHTRDENLLQHSLPIPPAGESAKSRQFPGSPGCGRLKLGAVISLKTGQAVIVDFDLKNHHAGFLIEYVVEKLGFQILIWQFGSY